MLQNVEDYAKRFAKKEVEEKANEMREEFVLNFYKMGLSLKDIAEGLDVSLDFVEKVLFK